MDFDKLLAQKAAAAPIEPRELYAALPDKAEGYGYLRDVQGQVLTAWHARRDERDLVVKVNTGGGKTIDGLVILQSLVHEGHGPGLYVAPDIYLAGQVREEADRIGIATVEDPDHPRYLAGEAIAVVNAYKLVNGRTVFSENRPTRRPAPIGSVVIDDAHAALATTRSQMALRLPRDHPAFADLLRLFEEDLRQQAPNALLDVQDRSFAALAPVPFWAWRAKLERARAALHKHRESDPLKFPWPAVSEVLGLCRAVFTGETLSITPHCPPTGHVTSFREAARRVYLTATLADDSVLVTDFGADPDSVRNPITPLTAGDIGERMILAPQEINPDLETDAVREAIADLAARHNTVVLVPSDKAAEAWERFNPRVVHADEVARTVEELRRSHLGLVVLVNKYDGIDLPANACRVLALDGLPEVADGHDRLQARVLRPDGADDRQIQRIEQGMGRGVRSNEDHCVVFLLGSHLSQLVADPRSFARFGPATRAQLELSRTVAANLHGRPLREIIEVAQQALNRDPGWIRLAKLALAAIPAPPGTVHDAAIARRAAFDAAVNGDIPTAAAQLSKAAAAAVEPREKGWLLELKAAYLDQSDPAEAQRVLAAARGHNPSVLRPLSGVAYQRLSSSGRQAQRAADLLAGRYRTSADLRLAFEGITDDLAFDPDRTDAHEDALARLAEHLGLAGQRPEQELGEGPDVLIGLGELAFWVVEAKSGATSDVIHKRDANQLSGSLNWFRGRYGDGVAGVPVMVHRARRLARDASAAAGMRVLTENGMGRLRAAVLAFAAALAADRWDQPDRVDALLLGHRLRAADLSGYLCDVQAA